MSADHAAAGQECVGGDGKAPILDAVTGEPIRVPAAAESHGYDGDYRVRVWASSARYHREHGNPTAANLAADVADAIRFYLLHLASPGFEKEAERYAQR